MCAFKARNNELKSKTVEFKDSKWISNCAIHNGVLWISYVYETYEWDVALPRANTGLGIRTCAMFSPVRIVDNCEGKPFIVNIDIQGAYTYEFCVVSPKKIKVLISRDADILNPMVYTISMDSKDLKGEKIEIGEFIRDHKLRAGKFGIPYFHLTQDELYCHVSSYSGGKSYNTFIKFPERIVTTEDILMPKDPQIVGNRIDSYPGLKPQYKIFDTRIRMGPALYSCAEGQMGILAKDGSGRERKKLSEKDTEGILKLMSLGERGFIAVYDGTIDTFTT